MKKIFKVSFKDEELYYGSQMVAEEVVRVLNRHASAYNGKAVLTIIKVQGLKGKENE